MDLLSPTTDINSRKHIADILIEAGYDVTVSNSAANVIHEILKNSVRVLLLSDEFDEMTAMELIPLLKKCSRDLTIILVTDNSSPFLIRRLRKEGIFYHALRPQQPEDREEIKLAVQCAFNTLAQREIRGYA